MVMQSQNSTPSASLLRVLGVGFGLAAVVGGVVGQGIMRAPGIVAGVLPGYWLILGFWVIGGILALIDGFAIMELASSIPRSGGPYVWADRAFGPFAGKMLGWTDWTNGVVGIGFTAVVFAEYLQRLGVFTFLPLGLIAVTLIFVLAAINWTGTRTSGASQTIGSAIKGLALLALILILFSGPSASPVHSVPMSPALTLAAVVIAIRAINNTYGGWNAAAYFCEEMHEPERNIVRATFGGILIVTILYVLVNAAILHVLTPNQMAASILPAADAAAATLGEASGTVMTGLAIFSVIAIANLTVMFVTRICHGMARDGYLPKILANVSVAGTPRMALYATTIGGALLASTGGYERLIAIGAPTGILINAAVDLAAIRLRYREPDLHRPFKMPLFPLPALIGLLINAALLIALSYEDPFNSLAGIAFVVVIGSVYKVMQWFRSRRLLSTQPNSNFEGPA